MFAAVDDVNSIGLNRKGGTGLPSRRLRTSTLRTSTMWTCQRSGVRGRLGGARDCEWRRQDVDRVVCP